MLSLDLRKRLVQSLLTTALLSNVACAQEVPAPAEAQATVWYLRHASWAVRIDSALLIFDYQEEMQMEDVMADTPRNLENGFIDPAEIAGLNVFVFVTHAHGDHYDPIIFEWQGEIADLTYYIGWEDLPESHCERFVGSDAACHTMGGLRATAELADIRVYTIDSFHNDIPEVAYLVRYGDWAVYHNGDYMADYVEDYSYLKTFGSQIDMAFVSGYPGRDWPHLARAVHLAREFEVPVLFPMHFRDEAMCEDFVAAVAGEVVSTTVTCPTARGQRFVVTKGGEER
jgi:L-ascorbate metabolism protein UlaG (beta-lactamase superfamily)